VLSEVRRLNSYNLSNDKVLPCSSIGSFLMPRRGSFVVFESSCLVFYSIHYFIVRNGCKSGEWRHITYIHEQYHQFRIRSSSSA
jgi:hypothetical protein